MQCSGRYADTSVHTLTPARRREPPIKPLLFVCRHVPDARIEAERTEFVPLPSPDGPVLQAFESHELAALIWEFYGSAENVFLLPETKMSPEQTAQLAGRRVLIYRTGPDYNGASLTNRDFPWADRVVRYDPGSLAARGVRGSE